MEVICRSDPDIGLDIKILSLDIFYLSTVNSQLSAEPVARKLQITNSADNPQKDKSELLPQLKQIGPMLKINLNNMETGFNKFTYCE